MADRSSIEWTETTWNPATGCDRVCVGCDRCYALTLARHLKSMGSPCYQIDGDDSSSGPGFGLTLHHDLVDLPHRWHKPRVLFVNSMSDLFHPEVPLECVQAVFEVMRDTPRHTYQILAKRSRRLRALAGELAWPLNVWMGVSVETARYEFRMDHLRDVPAAARFVCAEPLLEPLPDLNLAGIDWLIAGGESARHARTMQPDWVRDLRDQCDTDGAAFLFKKWGGRTPMAGGRVLGGRTHDDMPPLTSPDGYPAESAVSRTICA